MSTPIRRELERARLDARERRLRLVIQILGDREHRPATAPAVSTGRRPGRFARGTGYARERT